jgi:hypothetical protein
VPSLPSRPGPLLVAAALLAVEGAALSLVGIGYGVAAVVGDPDDRGFTLLEAGMVLLLGLALLLVARGVARARGWARSSGVTVQLLALPVGLGLAQNGVWLLAVPVLALAATVLYQLATPEARLAFRA